MGKFQDWTEIVNRDNLSTHILQNLERHEREAHKDIMKAMQTGLDGVMQAIQSQGAQIATLTESMSAMHKILEQRAFLADKIEALENQIADLKTVQDRHAGNWQKVGSVLTPLRTMILAVITGILLVATQTPIRMWIMG